MKQHGSILLVEDDADDVYFISRALRNSGLDAPIDIVNDGQAAIDFLRKAGGVAKQSALMRPCLVLLDLNIPFISGLEVLKWIRQQPVWRTVIVIVLTSSTSEADMNQAYTLGANSYIIKPSDATKLSELAQFMKAYWFGWNQLPPVCRENEPQAVA